MHDCCLQGPEEGATCPETGVIDSCKTVMQVLGTQCWSSATTASAVNYLVTSLALLVLLLSSST